MRKDKDDNDIREEKSRFLLRDDKTVRRQVHDEEERDEKGQLYLPIKNCPISGIYQLPLGSDISPPHS